MKRIVSASGKLTWAKRAYAVLVLCAATATALPAQTFTTLFSFDYFTDGYRPAGLVQATNGDFYGTALGGNDDCNGSGCGTVFKITPGGALKTLNNFCYSGSVACGGFPNGGLIQATNGDFYGTTSYGGANLYYGTVFKITPSGTLTTLYSFCSQGVNPPCTDGNGPGAGLIQATNGDLYGTTESGGAHENGTIFKITLGGTLTTLYSFCSQSGCTDGAEPAAGLIQATSGEFYGTTFYGGANTGSGPGAGTIFKITLGGTLTTLYSFCPQSGCADGQNPSAGLIQATNGDLYGTTESGGANGSGTIFKVTPLGTLTTLYSFCSQSGCTDGQNPSVLVQATDGNFYGTTFYGGANTGYNNSAGTIFKLTPGGTLTTLYSFCSQSGCTDGAEPAAGVIQATNGDFYGTTGVGGAYGGPYGTVFSLSVGLGPFVETRPTSGKVGATVRILGTDLTGTTSVTFNGTAAVFTVVSPSLITATVPTDATTGTVQVVIPGGTLLSNVKFQVRP